MVTLIADSCYPNCHPPGQTYSTFQQSGNAALGIVVLIIVGVIIYKILKS